jgi:hypothetical protein
MSRLVFLQRRLDLTPVVSGSFGGVLDEIEARPQGRGAGGSTAGGDRENGQRNGPDEQSSASGRRRSVSSGVTGNCCQLHGRSLHCS